MLVDGKKKGGRVVRIAIDGGAYEPNSIVSNGTERHLQQLIRQINKHKDSNIEWIYFHFGKKSENKTFIKLDNIVVKRLPQKGFSSFWMPLFCLVNKVDIFLGYSTYIPYLLKLSSIKKVSVIHDFGFLDFPEKYTNHNLLKNIFKNALDRADIFICFTGFIRERLHKLIKKEVFCIKPGYDNLNKIKSKKLNIKDKYILHVGRISGSKDIGDILKKFDFYKKRQNKNIKLILIGKNDDYVDILFRNKYYKSNKRSILILERLTDSELKYYYENSLFMIHSSLTEGLCFPLLEALSLGVPVFVQDKNLYNEYSRSFTNLYLYKDLRVVNKIFKKNKDINKKTTLIYSWDKYYNGVKDICLRLVQ